jgi:hypothetical protein
MRRCIAINSNLFRRSVLANGLSEEPLGSINASILAQQKIDSAALLINYSIEIFPSPRTRMYVSSTLQDLLTGRAKASHFFSNSGRSAIPIE